MHVADGEYWVPTVRAPITNFRRVISRSARMVPYTLHAILQHRDLLRWLCVLSTAEDGTLARGGQVDWEDAMRAEYVLMDIRLLHAVHRVTHRVRHRIDRPIVTADFLAQIAWLSTFIFI